MMITMRRLSPRAARNCLPLGHTLCTTASPPQNLIVDVDEKNFMPMVMQAPMPVILDAWAPWCNPCLQLAPKLEAEVNAQNGALRLAKLDTDQVPALAQQLRVTSLPSVFGLYQGKMVDAFQGLVPDEQLRAFFDKLLAAGGAAGAEDDADGAEESEGAMIDRAFDMIEDGDGEGAKLVLEEVLQSPGQASVAGSLEGAQSIAGIARCLVQAGDATGAGELAEVLQQNYSEHVADARVQQALSVIAMAAQGDGGASIEDLKSTMANNPDDPEAKFNLAQALAAATLYEEAIETALLILKKGKTRNWNDGAATQLILQVLDALGESEPHMELKKATRKRLSNYLHV